MNAPGKYERLNRIFDEVVARWPKRAGVDHREPEGVQRDLLAELPEHRRRVLLAMGDNNRSARKAGRKVRQGEQLKLGF